MKPTLHEWKELHKAAESFKGLETWNWMADSDIFGVENPEDGEIGYCSIMGALGEVFALSVYTGTDGLEGLLKVQSMEISDIDMPANRDLIFSQKCLMASFEDKEFLSPEDFKIINKLNLSFKGKNAWPLFRSYQPGKIPWYLTDKEARFLTVSLHQASEVALIAKNNPGFIFSTDDGLYLTRTVKRVGNELRWENAWVEPHFTQNSIHMNISETIYNEEKIAEIKQKAKSSYEIWEIDYSYLPNAIMESPDGKPWYPYVALWVESSSGFVLSFLISSFEEQKNLEKYKEKMLNHTLDIIEKKNSIPAEIRVRKEAVFELFKPVAERLGIKLSRREKLGLLDEASTSLESFFKKEDIT
jgi:hypothetical protein